MFSTCLFCHASLGANQIIEHFPIGRRLAYDPERGRLWAVCKRCTRWNLTPLEERWEAIDECERAYRDTRKRVSTDNIALARLADGTDLVRIGRPLLPEFAAWRYGEQLGVRRRRHLVLHKIPNVIWPIASGAGAALSLTNSLGYAAIGASAIITLPWTANALLLLTKIPVAHVTVPGAGRLPMRADDMHHTVVSFENDGTLHLHVLLRTPRLWLRFATKGQSHTLVGDAATRAMSDVIVGVNHKGAKASVTSEAVRLLEDGATEKSLLYKIVAPRVTNASASLGSAGLICSRAELLALEIALHEENERRAMAGELGALHARWEEAERVAKLADRDLTQLLDAARRTPDAVPLERQREQGE